ncbi:PREDICTED: tRNA (guanine-N(7)-)-methyltransferase non-catalytic subunit WDR4 [Ceratosolen solmsi marchali]|uniref:tRNA (Guanine-N(7)-)-methyltransferase non-catalytic subunit WDR4 n=1 Tax=Ceratosolen solmsi marchali TaxID=326594 RepID=A0AAJ7DXS5_9HYME|nr:PREDICTED: tRNA (guanine-N(7)-)-methyltransferase non-catalytic subunit WDR4 [Ceratosolen solmsi marchali]
MSFSIRNSHVVLCNNDSVLIYNLDSQIRNIIALPKLESKNEIRAHNREEIETFHILICVEFSNDGQYFLVCANRKQLCLFKTETLELISNRKMQRAASKVRFLPNNDIVVADKSGDAYLFSTSKPNENGQLLLGHLSMLLDILVTDDQKFIISADRDEKIRVSMFPNSYNILSYCLGHKDFVTNIAVVPHNKSILASSGGDGTLMFWDFKTGKELLTVYFHEKLSQSDLLKVNETLKKHNLEEGVTVSPVKHLKLLQLNEENSIILITFYCSNAMLVYRISAEENNLNVKYLSLVTLEQEPLECQYHKNNLWILMDKKIEIYKFNGETLIIDSNLNMQIQTLNELWSTHYQGLNQTLLPILYKRKFDNLQEYQERKKLRLVKKDA